MENQSVRIRYEPRGLTSHSNSVGIVNHPAGVQLPSLGHRVAFDVGDERVEGEIISAPLFEYSNHGDGQSLLCVVYGVKLLSNKPF
ncbi:hypothetical protein ACODYM_29450 [Burkholderia gladioli]|uniref:hypothetical protein n=1 Tax=Burkholderia gladioli TaxID=28095 RepID=UPI003B511615